MKKTFHYYDIYYKGKMYTSKVESLALAEAVGMCDFFGITNIVSVEIVE